MLGATLASVVLRAELAPVGFPPPRAPYTDPPIGARMSIKLDASDLGLRESSESGWAAVGVLGLIGGGGEPEHTIPLLQNEFASRAEPLLGVFGRLEIRMQVTLNVLLEKNSEVATDCSTIEHDECSGKTVYLRRIGLRTDKNTLRNMVGVISPCRLANFDPSWSTSSPTGKSGRNRPTDVWNFLSTCSIEELGVILEPFRGVCPEAVAQWRRIVFGT